VWVDGNADGVSASGELRTLGELGITELSLSTSAGQGTDNGNILGLNSSYRTADGTEHAAADVWFQIQPGSTAGTAGTGGAASMGERVNTLAQAIGVFDPAADAATNTLGGALVPVGTAGSAGTAAAPSTVAVSDMVDAMRRFVRTGQSGLVPNAGEPAGLKAVDMLASPVLVSGTGQTQEQAQRLAQMGTPFGVTPK